VRTQGKILQLIQSARAYFILFFTYDIAEISRSIATRLARSPLVCSLAETETRDRNLTHSSPPSSSIVCRAHHRVYCVLAKRSLSMLHLSDSLAPLPVATGSHAARPGNAQRISDGSTSGGENGEEGWAHQVADQRGLMHDRALSQFLSLLSSLMDASSFLRRDQAVSPSQQNASGGGWMPVPASAATTPSSASHLTLPVDVRARSPEETYVDPVTHTPHIKEYPRSARERQQMEDELQQAQQQQQQQQSSMQPDGYDDNRTASELQQQMLTQQLASDRNAHNGGGHASLEIDDSEEDVVEHKFPVKSAVVAGFLLIVGQASTRIRSRALIQQAQIVWYSPSRLLGFLSRNHLPDHRFGPSHRRYRRQRLRVRVDRRHSRHPGRLSNVDHLQCVETQARVQLLATRGV
jgi:hypothetical protein